MWFKLSILCAVMLFVHGEVQSGVTRPKERASLKPPSACCDVPEIAQVEPLDRCSNPKPAGPCDDVKCVFEHSGFLKDNGTLHGEAYERHLRAWAERQGGGGGARWSAAVDLAVRECVDKAPRQYLDSPCTAYDVFVCTTLAFIKTCPDDAWKC